jgi:hypothetical protein
MLRKVRKYITMLTKLIKRNGSRQFILTGDFGEIRSTVTV